ALDLAYPGFAEKLAFGLSFLEVEPGMRVTMAGFDWNFAENGHGRRDLGVRLDEGNRSLFYSGDGLPTEATLTLAKGCDLIVHEAFRIENPIPGHGSVLGCIDFARKAGAAALALVHMQRTERRERRAKLAEIMERTEGLRVFLPEPGAVYDL
ncbi:MAG: MBL fold metallo-hydrolase, partial [Acidobacteriota bacterium]